MQYSNFCYLKVLQKSIRKQKNYGVKTTNFLCWPLALQELNSHKTLKIAWKKILKGKKWDYFSSGIANRPNFFWNQCSKEFNWFSYAIHLKKTPNKIIKKVLLIFFPINQQKKLRFTAFRSQKLSAKYTKI
jgi:hypothetical protein